MIRHVVLFTFYGYASAEQRKEAITELRALKQRIPEIHEWSIGEEIRPTEHTYDLAEIATFENLEALDAFRAHPAHVAVRNLFSRIADWNVVDYHYMPTPEQPLS